MMRKVSTLVLTLVLALWLPLSAAVPSALGEPGTLQLNQPQRVGKVSPVGTRLQLSHDVVDAPVADDAGDALTGIAVSNKAPRRAIASVDDLTGKAVFTYVGSITSLGSTGGGSVTIAKGEDENTIVFKNWYGSGFDVVAQVDLEANTITIANQVVKHDVEFTIDDGVELADVEFAAATASNAINRAGTVKGTIAANGTITIATGTRLGFFVSSGTYAGQAVNVFRGTTFKPANGVMRVSYYQNASPAEEWNVVINQTDAKHISIENFGNHGKTVSMTLNNLNVVSVASQVVWNSGTAQAGDFYLFDIDDWGKGEETLRYNILRGQATEEAITFSHWMIMSATGAYTGPMEGATIEFIDPEAKFDITHLSVDGFEGAGTEADPYQITVWDHMLILSDMATMGVDVDENNASFAGKYFKLMNDLEAGEGLEPIGYAINGYVFGGHFDGGGHTINGVNINGLGYTGLFSVLSPTATVKNLTLTNLTINSTTNPYTGGIAGYCQGKVENCHVSGNITAGANAVGGIVGFLVGDNAAVTGSDFAGTVQTSGSYAGGIAGWIYSGAAVSGCHAAGNVLLPDARSSSQVAGGIVGLVDNSATLSDSYFSGNVTLTPYRTTSGRGGNLGGVAGYMYLSSVQRCFAVATVKGFYSLIGGLVGRNAGGAIENAYFLGYVDDANYVNGPRLGGLVGTMDDIQLESGLRTASLKNAYFSGELNTATPNYDINAMAEEIVGAHTDADVIENVYFDKQMFTRGSVNYAATTAQLTAAAGPEGFDAAVWNFTQGYYPRLKGIDTNAVAELGASVIAFEGEENTTRVSHNTPLHLLGTTQAANEADVATIANGVYTIGADFGDDVLTLSTADGAASRVLHLSVAPEVFDGAGTQANPYLINNKTDLLLLAQATGEGGQAYSGVYFKQTTDIDVEADDNFAGVGAGANAFGGHYDGDNHAIHHLALSGSNTGFIAALAAGGSLSNLAIAADATLNLASQAGALVGVNNGQVRNVKNYAAITATGNDVGGIVGVNGTNAAITGAYNAGNIAGGANVGGIAGRASHSAIENSQNVGQISAAQGFAGGIAGGAEGTALSDVLNGGYVSGAKAVGGIVGGSCADATAYEYDANDAANAILHAVDYGSYQVTDLSQFGAIAGNSGDVLTVVGSYYDYQLTAAKAAQAADAAGVTAATTATLTAGEALDGLDADLWQFAAGRYPVLKAFAAEAGSQAAAQVTIGIAEGQTTRLLEADATLAQAEGLTWTLAGDEFTIEGNTLHLPANMTLTAGDVLTATLGDYVKPIAIQAIAGVPLQGAGTQDDPYRLTSAEEWNALATYIGATGNSLDGKFIAVANDFAFGDDDTFQPIAADGVNSLGATLLGNGHTISGISYNATADYQAAIGRLNPAGSISDLTLEGAITSTGSYTGGFTAILEGTISRSTNNIAVTGGGNGVGGFAALAKDGAALDGDINNAAITATAGNYVGGLVGENVAADGLTFNACHNSGAIDAQNSAWIGGLLGYGQGSEFVDCYNTGNITGGARSYYVGGLFGGTENYKHPVVFTRCYNEGDITAGSAVAGLFGGTTIANNVYDADGSLYKATVTAADCHNSGNITATGVYSESSCAGLFAMLTPGSLIERCYNEGDITSAMPLNTRTAVNYKNTGGIAGRTYSSVEDYAIKVIDCHNSGAISGYAQVGGLLGDLNSYQEVRDSYNAGTVTGVQQVGGIAGYVSGNHGAIIDSYNAGNVKATKELTTLAVTSDRAGGAIGYNILNVHVTNFFNVGNIEAPAYAGGVAGYSNAMVSNSANYGTVKADNFTGGLIGAIAPRTEFGIGMIFNSYNAGKVISDNTATAANLVGNGASIDTEVNQIDRACYVTEFGTFDTELGTGVTLAALARDGMNAAAQAAARRAARDYDANEDTESAGWSNGDAYTLPIVAGMEDNDAARAYAAAVIVAEDNTFDQVDGAFNVGTPAEVTWSVSEPVVDIDGNFVFLKPEAAEQTITLTATCGDYSRDWEITFASAISTGIDNVARDATVIGEMYFDLDGRRVAKPATRDGKPYIVVRTHADGKREAVKVLN